jgi:hypothetical protein
MFTLTETELEDIPTVICLSIVGPVPMASLMNLRKAWIRMEITIKCTDGLTSRGFLTRLTTGKMIRPARLTSATDGSMTKAPLTKLCMLPVSMATQSLNTSLRTRKDVLGRLTGKRVIIKASLMRTAVMMKEEVRKRETASTSMRKIVMMRQDVRIGRKVSTGMRRKVMISIVTSAKMMKAILSIETSTKKSIGTNMTAGEDRKDQKRSLNPKVVVPSSSLDPSCILPIALPVRASPT